MLSNTASFITLAAFIIPIAFLIFRLPHKRLADMVFQALHGLLIGMGGLLFAGLVMRILGIDSAQVLSSVLVVIGALGCLIVYCVFFDKNKAPMQPRPQKP